MKKKTCIYILITLLVFVSGCSSLNNNPKQRVEEFFNNYQSLSEEVISQIDENVNSNSIYNTAQKENYKDILKDQYRNLTYEIKSEETNANKSVVKVEVTVKDYAKTIRETNDYLKDHKDQFMDNNNSYSSKFIDYQLDELKKTKDKVKYTLNLNLTLKDKNWTLDNLSNDDLDKISGIYSY